MGLPLTRVPFAVLKEKGLWLSIERQRMEYYVLSVIVIVEAILGQSLA